MGSNQNRSFGSLKFEVNVVSCNVGQIWFGICTICIFVPITWSGCYDQISEFFYCESLVLSGFLYWSTRDCNLGAHSSIHASFILRRGLARFQLPKGFLGLRKVECLNSSDILEWGPGAVLIGNITLLAP